LSRILISKTQLNWCCLCCTHAAGAERQLESHTHVGQKNSHIRILNDFVEWNNNSLWVIKERFQDFTGPTYFHLFMPVLLDPAVTDGSVDEPAKVTRVELPGRTLPFPLWGTFLDGPAGLTILLAFPHTGGQKQDLPFRMDRNLPPPLFVTVYGF
jgi:hypothetical protein